MADKLRLCIGVGGVLHRPHQWRHHHNSGRQQWRFPCPIGTLGQWPSMRTQRLQGAGRLPCLPGGPEQRGTQGQSSQGAAAHHRHSQGVQSSAESLEHGRWPAMAAHGLCPCHLLAAWCLPQAQGAQDNNTSCQAEWHCYTARLQPHRSGRRWQECSR